MAKYYADLNGKHLVPVESWDECVKIQKEIGGVNFKKYSSYEEAKAAINKATGTSNTDNKTVKKATINVASNSKSGKKKIKEYGIKPRQDAYIIGCDEVGKVEPFKQMISVAVFSDPSVTRDIKGGDSKGNSKEKDIEIGKAITAFESFDDVNGEAHYNKELGIIYCVRILTNKQYNSLKDTGRNADLVLSCLHNATLLAVYDEAIKQGFNIDCFVVDDYIGKGYDHRVAFGDYVESNKSGTRKINDTGVEMYFTDKCESKFPDTVGLASNIGDYIDQLWQKKCIDGFAKDGIEFDKKWFGNFGGEKGSDENAQTRINRVFKLLADKYEDIDKCPYCPKHTSYYTNYKKL